MYMLAYRNLGIFQENVVNRFLADVVKAADPARATVRAISRRAAASDTGDGDLQAQEEVV